MAPPKSTRSARTARRSIHKLGQDRRTRRRRPASRAIAILAAAVALFLAGTHGRDRRGLH